MFYGRKRNSKAARMGLSPFDELRGKVFFNSEGEGGGGGGGAGTGGDNGGAGGQPAAGGGTPGNGEGGGGTPPANFFDGFTDEALKVAAQQRGWKSPEDAVRDHESLFKLKGVPADQLLTMPKDVTKLDELKPIMTRLGLPETADKYDFKVTPGEGQRDIINDATNESAKGLRTALLGAFHGAMMPNAQTGAAMNAVNSWLNEAEQAFVNNQKQTTEREMGELKREWGASYDERIEMARRAGRQLGISGDVMDNLETITGAAGLLRHLSMVTEKLGVEKFADSGDGATNAQFFGKTKQQLESELSNLDAELGKKENRKRFDDVAMRRGADYEKRQAILNRLAEMDKKESGNA